MRKRAVAIGRACLAGCLASWGLAAAVAAGDREFTGGAALRETTALLRVPVAEPGGPSGWSGTAETRLRPFATLYFPHGSAAIEAEGRAAFSQGGGVGTGASVFAAGAPLRAISLAATAVDENGVLARGWIDRLDAAVTAGPLDLDIGRQPVHLGTSHFLGVLDVVAPFAPGDLDASFKPGVDAVRVRTNLGDMGEAEAIAVAADPLAGGAVLGRARLTLRGIDVEAVGGRFRRRGFGGLAWEGEVARVNLWGEAALFARGTEPWRGGWRRAAAVAVAGAEYSLPGDVRIGAGAMHSDFGTAAAAWLLATYLDAPHQEGWVFLGGRHYALLTADYEFHPLLRGHAATVINLNDGSALVQPVLVYGVSDNADLAAFGWIGLGRGPEGGVVPVPRSEFGMLPDGGGIYARWFF